MLRSMLLVAGMVFAATAVSVPPALQCPDVADAYTATGWQEYRGNRMVNARRAFTWALGRCPDHAEAKLGLGYVTLRANELDTARVLFTHVLRSNDEHVDALTGLGLVDWRTGRYEEARSVFKRVLELDPARADVRDHLASLPETLGPRPERAPLVLPDTLVYAARANGDRFEVRTGDGWAPFYINGVNLGAALPGRFPSEFPDATTYRKWIAEMAALGANTIRVYTLHPPSFYDALAEHNAAHPDRALWLLHGVWAELPPEHDYHDAVWKAEFFGEMERVIDVLHGRADVDRRPGHAAGWYTADVSRWTLGVILGREWEPYSVVQFNERFPDPITWHGRYFRIDDAPATDVWLAQAMDHIVAYETRQYRAQRPVAYTSWPTLDPMEHPTEIDVADELRIRGMKFDGTRRAHNEDEVSIGAVPVRTTAAFPAGFFAAFHAYPYYPDFMLHDADYARARSPWGPSSYYGYLLDLKRHFEGVPVVIAEYGVPASWGLAHFNAQGWHHGGLTEAQMADVNARMAREIAAAGMAGGAVFAWIDEWFKHNWLVVPLEQPAERNRMWWNRMNPEQHYGLVAVEPVPRLGETLAERSAAWDTITPLYATGDGTRIRAHADEAYLWLHVSGPAGRAQRLVLGLDITEPTAGGLRLPGPGAPFSPVAVDFVVVVDSTGARVLAAPGSNPFEVLDLPRGAARRDATSPIANRPTGFFAGTFADAIAEPRGPMQTAHGRFEPLRVVVNSARIGTDSTNHLGMGYDRGVLRRGPLPDGAWERSSDGDDIEVRIPWNLIGVTDPSSRHVAHGTAPAKVVDGIRIIAAAQRRNDEWQLWPGSGRRDDVAAFTWPTWEQPRFRSRRRPAFDAMRSVFHELSRTQERQVATP